MSNESGKTITLVYAPHGRFPAERRFDDVTENDIAFTIAGLVGRRMRRTDKPGAFEDLKQLAAAREGQMAWYADQMLFALDDGLGWWKHLLPRRVRERIIIAQMDYLRDVTAEWVKEIVDLHAETQRKTPRLKVRSAPESGPRVRCGGARGCTEEVPLGKDLPEGWSEDGKGIPHCPEHPTVSLTKEPVA
jgi:hypothetical protein